MSMSQTTIADAISEGTQPLFDRGAPQARFKVIWQEQNGEVKHLEIDAHDYADASFKTAMIIFDCTHPSGKQLLDVIRLR